jgi:hypothetical protein
MLLTGFYLAFLVELRGNKVMSRVIHNPLNTYLNTFKIEFATSLCIYFDFTTREKNE